MRFLQILHILLLKQTLVHLQEHAECRIVVFELLHNLIYIHMFVLLGRRENRVKALGHLHQIALGFRKLHFYSTGLTLSHF